MIYYLFDILPDYFNNILLYIFYNIFYYIYFIFKNEFFYKFLIIFKKSINK